LRHILSRYNLSVIDFVHYSRRDLRTLSSRIMHVDCNDYRVGIIRELLLSIKLNPLDRDNFHQMLDYLCCH
jgi:hypothetical protein